MIERSRKLLYFKIAKVKINPDMAIHYFMTGRVVRAIVNTWISHAQFYCTHDEQLFNQIGYIPPTLFIVLPFCQVHS